AYNYAATVASLKNKRVVRYEKQPTLVESLIGAQGATRTAGSEGINVHVDANALRGLMTPRPMYLWRGE
ncbi:MAG: hypothetical protein ACREJC_04960, partial [Tepidisphaeraceae bacterium]